MATKKSSGSGKKSAAKSTGPRINPREFFQMFLERWWIGLIAALPIAAGIIIFAPDPQPLYRAEATLLFDPRPDRVLPVQTIVDTAARTATDLNNQIERIRGKQFFDIVLTSFTPDEQQRIREAYRDPENPDAPLPSLAAIIRPSLGVVAKKGTTIVGVQITNRSPELAALIANRFAEQFRNYTIDQQGTGTNNAIFMLRTEKEKVRKQLEDAEIELQAYKERHSISSIGESQTVAAQKTTTLGTTLVNIQMEQSGYKSVLDRVAEFQASGRDLLDIPQIRDWGDVTAVLDQIKALEAERVYLGVRYLEKHPVMEQNQLKIDEMKRRLDQTVAQALTDFQTRYKLSQQREAELRSDLAQAEQLYRELDKTRGEYQRLEGEVAMRRTAYNKIADKLTDANIASSVTDQVGVRVFEQAQVPGGPVNMGTFQAGLLAAGTGAALLIGIPILLGLLDSRIKSVSHVQDGLGETLLGAVKKMKGLAEAERAHVFITSKDSALAEAYRGIFSEIEIRSKYPFPKSIIFTSSVPGEGKSLTSCNLGAVFAAHNKRTLLIDCDLRRPTLHRYFGVDGNLGLLQWVEGHLNDPATTPELPAGIVTIAPNFDMLPGGGAARNATEILDHFVGASLLDRLYAQYDLVMLDTPPVAVFPDALLLCRTRAELIYICRFETVRLGMARKSLARIHDTDMSVLGVVLNQIPSKRVKAYGYEGYGSYDSHYYKAYASPSGTK